MGNMIPPLQTKYRKKYRAPSVPQQTGRGVLLWAKSTVRAAAQTVSSAASSVMASACIWVSTRHLTIRLSTVWVRLRASSGLLA